MEEQRPNSEQLLKRLQYEEREQKKKTRGKLKIFLGYAAGCGKTCCLCSKAAHEAKNHGIDVVVPLLTRTSRQAGYPGADKGIGNFAAFDDKLQRSQFTGI